MESPPSSVVREQNDSSSALSLSLTPPLSSTAKNNDEDSISEHLLSSIENDRSLQELEVSANLPEGGDWLSPPLEIFICNSLEGRNNAASILDEILNNEQFKSDTESAEASLDLFANVDLSDRILNGYKPNKGAQFNFEEIIAVKDSTIAALTSELDSFRELLSNGSTNSLGTSTEYKQYQDECHSKLVEYHDAITHKDDQLEKLAASLQQSILQREELKQQFKNEISQLQEQLQETSRMLQGHKCQEDVFAKETKRLIGDFQRPEDLKSALDKFVQGQVEERRRGYENEISNLKIKMEADRLEYETELTRLNVESSSKEILDEKHAREMEELRTYFEKKCADLEKNYSEEIFSQHSKKHSLGSSISGSDTDLSSSDMIFNQPGPGGDTKVEYTKKDFVKLRESLKDMAETLDGFNLTNLSNEEFDKIKNEIGRFELKNLLKYDLTLMKNELQNKYHAELEILREDFDERVDLLRLEHENELKITKARHSEEIEELTCQLRGRVATTAQQEVGNSGEFEIDEVVQSYERRLQEQVTLAKIDIIGALENQIQRLVSSDSVDDEWPEELLQLRNKFSEKYKTEIVSLQNAHESEISRLKEEHSRTLNGALERARRRSLRDQDSLNKGELELVKDRDSLKKQNLSLRNLLGELLKYFTQCEDELNNTLVEELINKNEEDVNVKRVHLTPNFQDLLSLIDSSSSDDNDLLFDTEDLKSELDLCLEKLKSDANAILALTNNLPEGRIECRAVKRDSLERELSSLTRKLISEAQIKNELAEQLSDAKILVESMESDRGALEGQLEMVLERQKAVEGDLMKARGKIAELIENGHKEVVSQGYGEEGHKSGLVNAVADLNELQEKARSYIENPGNLDQNLLDLVENLARVGERIIEEAGKDKVDLRQQIEAADKKYKTTCRFLEDQAAEREQERDEAQKEIDRLNQLLRDRDKDRASCEQIMNEVDNLERQIRDLSRLLDATEKRCGEVEDERAEAVEKIAELRDIIRDLEDQLKVKTRNEEDLRQIIEDLESFVRHNNRSDDESNQDLTRDVSSVGELHRYIGSLEGQVQKLRLSAEIAGSEGALQQIKNHLFEFETTLDKRTRDLELLHSTISTTACSSPPSEDMSIRDLVQQQQTPNIYDECEVPLQQLARLKEKLIRHSRAEDAALKRIRDLEMQSASLKNDLEESTGEREMLRRQISDHLVLISNLQIRLDEQRIRAEHIEKQTNSNLEVQNYDLKNNIVLLEEQILKRDKNIGQLKSNIEDTKKRVVDLENELMMANREGEILAHMQAELEFLRAKSVDGESLREKLSETERKLEVFVSWNLNKGQIEQINELTRVQGVSFQDLLDSQMRRVDNLRSSGESLVNSLEIPTKNDLTVEEEQISRIERVGGGGNLFYSLQPLGRQNSTEKHVRFEDDVDKIKIRELEVELVEKNRLISDYQERLNSLGELEEKVKFLQLTLEETQLKFQMETQKSEEEYFKLRTESQQIQVYNDKLQKEAEKIREKLNKRIEELADCQMKLKQAHSNLEEAQDKLKDTLTTVSDLKKKLAVVQSELNKLEESSGREINNLHTLLGEKDKVIHQMEEDSKSLHVNLETIQAKLQESGNIVDLTRRLRDEQKKNSDLLLELHGVKAQLMCADDDITGQVRRELDYSAYLDQALISAVEETSIEDVEALKLAVRKQKAVNRHLVKAKEAAEKKFDSLERLLQSERGCSQSIQLGDAKIIEQLRVKLEGALDDRAELERLLQRQKQDVDRGQADDSADKRALQRKVDLLEETNESLNEEMGRLRKLRRANEDEIKELRTSLSMKLQEVLSLEGEVERLKLEALERDSALSEMENDRRAMKRQMDHIILNQKPRVRDPNLPVPEELMEKIKELKVVAQNNMQMVDLVTRLTNEKSALEERISVLESENPRNLPFDDPVSRANYLFARYLRAESYRKALTWQKRYLVSLLETYQSCQLTNVKVTLPEAVILPANLRRSSGKKRFKRVALVLIVVSRLRYLVRRWHSGQRLLKTRNRPTTNQNVEFHVGQPVSRQNFTNHAPVELPQFKNPTVPNNRVTKSEPLVDSSVATIIATRALSADHWSGNSPPSKDVRIRQEDAGLTSPGLLSKYVDRFVQIQQKLGLEAAVDDL